MSTASSRMEKLTNVMLADRISSTFTKMKRQYFPNKEIETEGNPSMACASDFFSHLSLEIICHILDYLPLRDVLRMEQQCKKIQRAVSMHLRVRKSIDFVEGEIFSWIPSSLNDMMLAKLIARCSELDSIYGFHSKQILKRRQRGSEMLTIPGIIAALSCSKKLKGIEVSDISLLEAVLNYLPLLEILGTFKNRNGVFPVSPSNKLILTSNPKMTSIHLTGVVMTELPRMVHVKHIYLRWVKFTHSHPFRDFAVPSLQTFVMSNCSGPISTLKYVPLITGLAAARSLTRLELVRVPFLGGLFQHIVEDSWRVNGFSRLQTVAFGSCRHAQEVDLGFLMITAAAVLEALSIQPSLTKDSLFAAIKMADVRFPVFETLHLGYVDPFPEPGKWNAEDLVMLHGLAEVTENPAMITDIGMKAIGQCFSFLRNLEVYNCPHLHFPTSWITNDVDTWSQLRHLHLRRCHAIRLQDFCRFVELLPQLELLHLEYMFREPPKGCARVGLSAGTGLGVSSALVQNNGNDGGHMDGGNHHHDDGDLNRDDNNNNNNNNVDVAGDVNNNDDDEFDNVHQEDVINLEGYFDDDDFDDFSDNPDDLDFDGLIILSDEENIDMANHIANDIVMAEVANAAKGKEAPSTSKSKEVASTSKDKDFVSSSKSKDANDSSLRSEARPSTSRDDFDPKPSTSQDYSQYSGCCRKSGMSNVESRSTCQLVDIDIGDNSDTDVDSPPAGKIKVKVESNSTLEQRPKDELNKETSTSKHYSVKDISTQPEYCKSENGGSKVQENNDLVNNETNIESEKVNNDSIDKNTDLSGCDKKTTSPEKSSSSNVTGVGSNNKHSLTQQQSSIETASTSVGDGENLITTQDQSSNCSEDSEQKHSTSSASDIKCTNNVNIEHSRSNSVKGRHDQVDSEGRGEIPKASSSHTEDNKDKSKLNEDSSSSSSKESSQNTASGMSGHDNVEVRNEDLPKPKSAENSQSGEHTNPIDTDSDPEDIYRELAKHMGVDLDAPRVSAPSSNLLFTDEEVKELLGNRGNGQGSSDDDEDEKAYNMRPRKRGKSLNGKKKGLVKKRRKDSYQGPRMLDKSCQAISDEIRETTKRAKEQDDARAIKEGVAGGSNSKCRERRKTRSSLSTKSADGSSVKKEENGGRTAGATVKRRRNMVEKSTSTSDPVIEDDHIQVLSLRSKSLMCVSLYMVGVTDIIIDECPNLTLLRGSACRVLKKVTVGGAPELSKVSFAQCRKMDERHLVNEVCDQISQTNRVIYLRPMRQFEKEEFERMLFSQPDIDYHLCVVYDSCPDPTATKYNHARVTTWLDLLSGMNMELLKMKGFEQAKNFPVTDDDEDKCYRNTYTLEGENGDGSAWSLSTDLPWLKHLSACHNVDSSDLHPDDFKAGLYCPRRKGHYLATDCLMDLDDVITDMRHQGVSLYCYTVVIYVNLCDVSGTPTPDIYL